MKIHCPGCDTALGIDPTKIPKKGAHATCPHCHQRLFINAEAQARLDSGSDAPSPSNPGPAPVEPAGPIPGVPAERTSPPVSIPDSEATHVYRLDTLPPGAMALPGTAFRGPLAQAAGSSPEKIPSGGPKPPPAKGLPTAMGGLEPAPWEIDPDIEAPRLLADTGLEPKHLLWVVAVLLVIAFTAYAAWYRVRATPQELAHPYSPGFIPTMEAIQNRMAGHTRMTAAHRPYLVKPGDPEAQALTEILNHCGGCSEVKEAVLFPMPKGTGFRAEVTCGKGAAKVQYDWVLAKAVVNDRSCP